VFLFSFYDSPASCDADVSRFESYINDVCLASSGGNSMKYDFPNVYSYAGGICAEPAVSSESLPVECVEITEYPTLGDNLASQWAFGEVVFGHGGAGDDEGSGGDGGDSGSDSGLSLSNAAIGGIAAGGAVAVVGLAAAVYFFFAAQGGAATSAVATAVPAAAASAPAAPAGTASTAAVATVCAESTVAV
jgi:hypothetical protein